MTHVIINPRKELSRASNRTSDPLFSSPLHYRPSYTGSARRRRILHQEFGLSIMYAFEIVLLTLKSYKPYSLKKGLDASTKVKDPGYPAQSAQAGLDRNSQLLVNYLHIKGPVLLMIDLVIS